MNKITEQIKNMGLKTKDFVVKKVNSVKDNFNDKRYIEEAFKKEQNYLEFTIHFLEETENMIKTLFASKVCGLLVREENKICLAEKMKMEEGQYLQDKNNNKYFVTYVSSIPYCYTISKDDKELKKELTELEYTDKVPEKPLSNIVNNITNIDNSTNIKGNKGNINSDNAKIEKTTNAEIELNANLHKD